MFSAEVKLLDLGKYKRFRLQDCLKEKINTLTLDEGGLSSPLSISLVIPIKFESEKMKKLEEETLHRILSQCSGLVDAGFLDEIVIMGATQTPEGRLDYGVLQKIVKIAYEELGLFQEQVNLLNKYESQNQRAKRGLIDFFLKVVHQFDMNILNLLAKYGVFGFTGYFGIPPGKGAGMWLAVPITQGDIICFVDADIVDFEEEYITGLCHSIVCSWRIQEASIKFVKAYYNRITTFAKNSEQKVLGGRVTRLLTIPLMKAIADTFKLYLGLESMKYPLAGEFAVSRDLLEQYYFPNTYAIETSLLFQTYDLIGPSSMAQLDLGIYRHIGQEFPKLKNMAYQITDAMLREVDEKLGRALTGKEETQFAISYEKNVACLIEEYEKLASRLKRGEKGLIYSKESDKEKTQLFKRIINNVLLERNEGKKLWYIISPSWARIKEKTGNYFALKEMLRRRANQSTWSRLEESGLLSQ